MIRSISVEQVIKFHHKIIEATGGSNGIRNQDLIVSALNRGLSTFDGEDLYRNDKEKIAAITHSLITNHGFVDGNKRIGVAVFLLLLELNKIEIRYTQEELIALGIGVASGEVEFEDIVTWVEKHSK